MTESPRIALATFSELPDWEKDDRPLFAALEERGCTIEHPSWSDPEVDWKQFDVCLLRTVWDYQERFDEFMEWIERVASETRLLNPVEVVRWNSKKSYLRELEDRGARCVPTVWLDAGNECDLESVLQERGWERGFIKPVVGANARETYRFRRGSEELRAAQHELERLLAEEAVMLQPYLESVETRGEVSLLFFDDELSHGVRKVPASGDYRVQDDWGASDEPWTPSQDELSAAREILDVTQSCCSPEEALLYARLDFLFLPDGSLGLNEVEVIEPSLFFRHDAQAAGRLADALLRRLAT